MINIEYDFGKSIKLHIKGHANAAPYGEDIYCAGVSALTVALSCALKDAKSQGFLDVLKIDLKGGDTHIRAVPKKGHEALVATIFTTIFNGYDAMSMEYPEYVSFKPRGVEKSTK